MDAKHHFVDGVRLRVCFPVGQNPLLEIRRLAFRSRFRVEITGLFSKRIPAIFRMQVSAKPVVCSPGHRR